MLTIETKTKIKVLWLANWTADEIAEFCELPIDEVEAMIKIYSR